MGIPAKTLGLAEKHYTFKYFITMKVMQLRCQKRFSAGPTYPGNYFQNNERIKLVLIKELNHTQAALSQMVQLLPGRRKVIRTRMSLGIHPFKCLR